MFQGLYLVVLVTGNGCGFSCSLFHVFTRELSKMLEICDRWGHEAAWAVWVGPAWASAGADLQARLARLVCARRQATAPSCPLPTGSMWSLGACL